MFFLFGTNALALQGLAKAIFNLGLMYEKRRGVSPDAPEADLLEATRECYEAAAGAGVTKAMVNLGVLYLSGRLPGREQSEALEWFKKAADEEDLSGEGAVLLIFAYMVVTCCNPGAPFQYTLTL